VNAEVDATEMTQYVDQSVDEVDDAEALLDLQDDIEEDDDDPEFLEEDQEGDDA